MKNIGLTFLMYTLLIANGVVALFGLGHLLHNERAKGLVMIIACVPNAMAIAYKLAKDAQEE